MEQQVAWGAGKPGDEDRLLSAQSDTEALLRTPEQGAGLFSPGSGLGGSRRLQRDGGSVAGECRATRGGVGRHRLREARCHDGFGVVSGAGCQSACGAGTRSNWRHSPGKSARRRTGEELRNEYPAEALLAADDQRCHRTQQRQFIASTCVSGSRRALRTWRPTATANRERSTRLTCAAKRTCWLTTARPQPPSSRSCWITEAS
jgi:hypothetical protein